MGSNRLSLRSWLDRRSKRAKRQRRERRAALGTLMEPLESRTLLTIVYTPAFGVETPNSAPPYTVMSSPTVHIVLWGPAWGTGPGQFNPAPVIAEATAILNSTQINGLTEYGSDGKIGSIDSFVDTDAVPSDFDPGNLGDGTSLGEAQTELNSLVTAGDVAGPGSPSDDAVAPIYAIITDPNHSDGTNGGYNATGTVSGGDANILGIGTDSSFFALGDTFSHEIVEHMADPQSGGVTVTGPAVVPVAVGNGSDNFQICDGECEPGGQSHYTYKIGGPGSLAIVQPFYSVNFSAFIVDDGNAQQFNLTPNWTLGAGNNDSFNNNYELTINGDQMANKNDNIVISRDSAGGTEVSLDGQDAWFDPGASNFIGTPLKSITINGLSGDNNITIDYSNGNPIPSGGLTINGGTGNDTLIALGQSNSWQITGANGGTLNTNIAFSNVQNLDGGSGSDSFQFSPGGSVSGNIDGGAGGTNTLDYSALAGPITLNLQTNTAPDIGGTYANINNLVGTASNWRHAVADRALRNQHLVHFRHQRRLGWRRFVLLV